MTQRKQAIIVMIPAFVLLLFGAVVYSQYFKAVDLDDYTRKFYYLQKYIFYCFVGGIGAVIVTVLLRYLRIKRKLVLAYIFIALAVLFNLLSSELPFIAMVSGREYIRFLHIYLKVSAVTLILLLFAFFIIQQKLLTMSKYAMFIMNGISILFVLLVAAGEDSESTFVAALLFLFLLIRFSSGNIWMKVVNSIIYCAVVGGFYIGILLHNKDNISTWLNPYQDKLGKGYMKVQDFEIMKSALILGRSSYHNEYSREILPTILILFGWGAFIIILAILIFMLLRMFCMASERSEMFSGKVELSIAAYFITKLLFCILVFFNVLPFFQGGHLPFIGYGSELVVDIILLSVFLYQHKNGAVRCL